MSKEIENLQKVILDTLVDISKLSFYKDDKEFYFSLDDILFFEIEARAVFAHSRNDFYKVKFRLYELEQILPKQFTRVSKSTILNTLQIFSIEKNLASYNLVPYYNSHKQV